jgi:hypothetical protein
MLAFANVMHLFPHEFSGLRGWRFAFTRIFPCPFQSLLFRHDCSPLQKMMLEQWRRDGGIGQRQ